MFVVDAAVLLPHAPHVVARVVERVHALPRWCAGLRRMRHFVAGGPAGGAATDDPVRVDCLFTYVAADVRLTLRARTDGRAVDGLLAARRAASLIRHSAEGDGVALAWSFAVEDEPVGAPGGSPRTRLRARTTLSVDPAHPTAAVRAALCRQVARRAPADLERLRALLARYEYGKPRPLATPPGPARSDVAPLLPADGVAPPHLAR